MTPLPAGPRPGFTLVELLVGIALLAVLLALMAPSVRDLLTAQRVRSINAELVTDLQFARSEAVRRGRPVLLTFRVTEAAGSNPGSTCYTMHLPVTLEVCDCRRGIGRACGDAQTEIKTVAISRRLGVTVAPSRGLIFEATGLQQADAPAVPFEVTVGSGSRGALRTSINAAGRPTVCSPQGAFPEVPACVE